MVKKWWLLIVVITATALGINNQKNQLTASKQTTNSFSHYKGLSAPKRSKLVKNKTNNRNPFLVNLNLKWLSCESLLQTFNGDIYACTFRGLWKSTDQGVNWTHQISEMYMAVRCVLQSINGDIYAGTEDHGVWKSSDNGQTWMNVKFETWSVKLLFQTISGDIYAGTEDNNDLWGVWKSSDNGQTWIKVTALDKLEIVCMLETSDGDIYAGAAHCAGMFKSTDQGQTWIKVTALDNFVIFCMLETSDGDIYVGTEYNGLWKSSDNGQTWTQIMMYEVGNLLVLFQASNGDIYMGTRDGILKSSDKGNSWKPINWLTNERISICSFLETTNGDIYMGTPYHGLFVFSRQAIFSYQTSERQWWKSKTVVLLKDEKTSLNLKAEYLISATWDGKLVSIPQTNLKIPNDGQEHTLIMTLKEQYVTLYQNLFGEEGDQITRKFWIKQNVDETQIQFHTNSDTNYYNVLLSDTGNTSGWKIVQTKVKDPVTKHPATLYADLTSQCLVWNQCSVTSGTVDKNNNWISTGKQKRASSHNEWKNGLYHLNLTDVVGNYYNALLEVGETNWKAKGDVDDQKINQLKQKLHVTIQITSPTKQELIVISQFLQRENQFVGDKIINVMHQIVASKGGGFDYGQFETEWTSTGFETYLLQLTIKDTEHLPSYEAVFLTDKYKLYLTEKVTSAKDKYIKDAIAKEKEQATWLKIGLDSPNPIKNKTQLNQYQVFVGKYYEYLRSRFNDLRDQAIAKSGLGYLTADQITQLRKEFVFKADIHISTKQFNVYLKPFAWSVKTTPKPVEFLQHIDLKRFNKDVQDWVDKNINPNPRKQLQTDIDWAVQHCRLHGASLATLLTYGHKTAPQTKQQIGNFDGHGSTFQAWLQRTADEYQQSRQVKQIITIVGFSIGGVTGLLMIVMFIFWWYRTWFRGRLKLDKKTQKIIVPQHLQEKGWDTIDNLVVEHDKAKTKSEQNKKVK